MEQFNNIVNGERGSSVRAKLNSIFQAIITGSEGINAIWNKLRGLEDAIDNIDTGSSALTNTIRTNTAWGNIQPNEVLHSGMTLQEIVEKATVKEILATVSLSGLPTPVLSEVGTEKTIVLMANVNQGSAFRLVSVSFFKNSTEIETKVSGISFGTPIECSVPQTISDTSEFLVRATFVRKDQQTQGNCSASLTYNFTRYSYWGVVNEGVTPDSSIVAGFSDKALVGNKNKSISSTPAKILVYSYPKAFGALSSIKDANGYDYITDFTRIEITIDGVAYYCYYQQRANNNSINYLFS